MKVRYTPRARDDIRTVLTYVERHSAQGAMRKTIEVIERFPEAGRLAGEQGTRVLPVGRYPYLAYWRIEGQEAWLVHVRHTARRPWNPDKD